MSRQRPGKLTLSIIAAVEKRLADEHVQSYTAIAAAIGISKSSVSRIANHLRINKPMFQFAERPQGRPIDPTRWRRCDHPRTLENTSPSGPNGACCRECKNAWARRYRSGSEGKRPTTAQRGQQPADDTSIALYRAEKAKRAGRPDPRMVEAAAALQRVLEAEAQARKGGRPKSQRNASGNFADETRRSA